MRKTMALFAISLMVLLEGGAQASSRVLIKGDVTVPVPVSAMGTLTVVGEKGASQSDDYIIKFCRMDPSGIPMRFGCTERTNGGKLNHPILLQEGDYEVRYSNTLSELFKIKRGEATRLELRKIIVPKVNGQFQFDVFVDLTDPSEQDRLLRRIWSNAVNRESVESYCPKGATSYACVGWNGSDHRALRDQYVLFSGLGEVSLYYLNLNSIAQTGRVMVTDPKDGEFVSVFPGIYGIRFTTPDGEKLDQFGIRVE